MDVVGSEIGQKMRSAIKAKLTELGCYVDDELPDYVMVMVANKRTRMQMEDDLQLFLGDNTELFVNWLHQVLKKLQEVTVTTPLKPETEKCKEKSKVKKAKDKKIKDKTKLKKTELLKKGKKKHKTHHKKEEKKIHKSKKKSKHHEMIHPNVPPLLMNMEKESEPSITDVFAGQILKKHGFTIDSPKKEEIVDVKPVVKEIKRPILPIIDPATIPSQSEPESSTMNEAGSKGNEASTEVSETVQGAPRQNQIKEINEIEAKIQGLKQKLAEQLDSMSDDEDFLTIRTEAEELMNDFAEDVFQEISSQTPAVVTPPLQTKKSPTPPPPEIPKEIPKESEQLPQIELKLPKRPIRERLGAREEPKKAPEKIIPEKKVTERKAQEEQKKAESPERFTPERDPDFWGKGKSAKSRLGGPPETAKRASLSDDSADKRDNNGLKRMTSTVSVASLRPVSSCASVVRVRPRPRRAPASSLLLRAVADAHKSLLNIPPKVDPEPPKVKRALVLPMRRCVDAQKIVIQVPASDADEASETANDTDKEEYVPTPLSKKMTNSDYVPSRRCERTSSRKDDTLIIETINIHNTTVGKDKETQFIVTMDGFNPNAFLAKKLMTEGLLNDEEEMRDKLKAKSVLKNAENTEEKDKKEISPEPTVDKPKAAQKKRSSDTSEDSDTQVIISKEDKGEKRKGDVAVKLEEPTVKKRKASPIVFDVGKKEDVAKNRERERTKSASSDNHVTVTTTSNTSKYDSLPPLSPGVAPRTSWCRAFPLCRFGASCAFAHPRCKFAQACSRRACPYHHPPRKAPDPAAPTAPAAPNAPAAPTAPLAPPLLASHVVPAANFKSISPATTPSICKFYPNCVNPICHFYHPKPCRYGKACGNKSECNFYHGGDSMPKWRYPV